jgi:hypothetical protein
MARSRTARSATRSARAARTGPGSASGSGGGARAPPAPPRDRHPLLLRRPGGRSDVTEVWPVQDRRGPVDEGGPHAAPRPRRGQVLVDARTCPVVGAGEPRRLVEHLPPRPASRGRQQAGPLLETGGADVAREGPGGWGVVVGDGAAQRVRDGGAVVMAVGGGAPPHEAAAGQRGPRGLEVVPVDHDRVGVLVVEQDGVAVMAHDGHDPGHPSVGGPVGTPVRQVGLVDGDERGASGVQRLVEVAGRPHRAGGLEDLVVHAGAPQGLLHRGVGHRVGPRRQRQRRAVALPLEHRVHEPDAARQSQHVDLVDRLTGGAGDPHVREGVGGRGEVGLHPARAAPARQQAGRPDRPDRPVLGEQVGASGGVALAGAFHACADALLERAVGRHDRASWRARPATVRPRSRRRTPQQIMCDPG